jgi:predicted GNAT family acetyltransferase
MILNKIITEDQKDDAFYLLFSKVFCSKKIDKEIGSKVYDDKYGWYYLKNDNNLVGFLSFKIKKQIIDIKDFYVFKEYRGKGVASGLLKILLSDYIDFNFYVICNNNSKNIFKQNNFIIYKEFIKWAHMKKIK